MSKDVNIAILIMVLQVFRCDLFRFREQSRTNLSWWLFQYLSKESEIKC